MAIRAQLTRMTPIRFAVLLLAAIFVTETGIMFVLPVMVSPHANKLVTASVDAVLLVVILAPVLWWMVIHPLRSRVVSERGRAAAIVRAAFHGIITIDEAGSVESINPEVERLFGYREEELVGKPVTLLMPERYREHHQAGVDRARSTATSPHLARKIIEVEGLRKDGSEFHLELSMVGWQHAGARKYAGFVRDITARKSTAFALRASEQRYRAVVENIDEIVYVVEATGDPFAGRVVFVSDRAERTAGYAPREFLENHQLWSSLIHPDDVSSVESLTRQMFSERTPITRRYRIRHARTNSYRWLDDRIVPRFEPDGSRVTLFGVARDITETMLAEEALKQSEERYREMFMDDLTGAYVATSAGRLIACNPAFASMFGFASVEDALRLDLASVYKSPQDEKAFLDALRAERRVENRETEYRRQNGKPLHVRQNAVGIFDGGGELIEIRGYLIETTQQKQLEDQLRQAQKMEAVGELAGGIAHDFNNILTAILGFSELLLASFEPGDPRRADAEEVVKAGKRGASLTHQLLAFSRRQIVQPVVLDVNIVVTEIEGLIRRLIGEHGEHIDFRTILSAGQARVRMDRGQLEQVLTNVAINARDAMPDGGELTVETSEVQLGELEPPGFAFRPGPYVLVSITDTGTGIDAETLQHIFDPFFTTKAIGRGTGLGLSTVYGIVKQADGFIDVESRPGGTMFKIYLPRTDEPITAAEGAPRTLSRALRDMSILIVEDDPAVRELVRKTLSAEGCRILEAGDGSEALRLLERHGQPIDLVLTDVVMPGMGGRPLADHVGRRYPELKILFMSGYPGPSTTIASHGVLNPGVFFLEKPFSPYALKAKVLETLR